MGENGGGNGGKILCPGPQRLIQFPGRRWGPSRALLIVHHRRWEGGGAGSGPTRTIPSPVAAAPIPSHTTAAPVPVTSSHAPAIGPPTCPPPPPPTAHPPPVGGSPTAPHGTPRSSRTRPRAPPTPAAGPRQPRGLWPRRRRRRAATWPSPSAGRGPRRRSAQRLRHRHRRGRRGLSFRPPEAFPYPYLNPQPPVVRAHHPPTAPPTESLCNEDPGDKAKAQRSGGHTDTDSEGHAALSVALHPRSLLPPRPIPPSHPHPRTLRVPSHAAPRAVVPPESHTFDTRGLDDAPSRPMMMKIDAGRRVTATGLAGWRVGAGGREGGGG